MGEVRRGSGLCRCILLKDDERGRSLTSIDSWGKNLGTESEEMK